MKQTELHSRFSVFMTNKEDRSLCKAENPSTCIGPVQFVGDPVNCKSSWTFQAGVHHNLNENKQKISLVKLDLREKVLVQCTTHSQTMKTFKRQKPKRATSHNREHEGLRSPNKAFIWRNIYFLCQFKLQIQTFNSVCFIYSTISLGVCAKSIPKERDSRSKCRMLQRI